MAKAKGDWYVVSVYVFLPEPPHQNSGYRGLLELANALQKMLGVERLTLSHADVSKRPENGGSPTDG